MWALQDPKNIVRPPQGFKQKADIMKCSFKKMVLPLCGEWIVGEEEQKQDQIKCYSHAGLRKQ